ncbi:lipopolysaccharide biosynthesis protein [Paludibaculum fermentans]|uniref:lipopolysaccharide biosynthesis protein n=1 Tax=Paludibaculum fermentans TaxID=1473598 RepID=UPI003EB9F96D
MQAAANTNVLPNPAPSLRLNFAWTAAGNGVYSACQWGMVAVLARTSSPELVGRYALGMAVSAPILLLAQMNLRALLATDVRGEHRFSDYTLLRAVTLLAAVALSAGVALSGGYAPEAVWTIVLVAVAQAIEGMSDIYQGQLQQAEQMNKLAFSLSVRGLLSLAALAAVMIATGSLPAALLAISACRLAVLFFYDRPAAAACAIKAENSQDVLTRRLWSLTRMAAPLGAVMMLGSLSTNVPRYFIAREMSEASLGIFAAVFTFAAAGNMVVNALGQAATPKLARFHAEGDRAGFLRLSLRLGAMIAGLGALSTLGCLLFGKFVLTLVFGPVYAGHSDAMVAAAVAGGAGWLASISGYILTSARCLGPQVPILLASVAITAAACAFLIPPFGLIGAAAALGAGSAAQVAGNAIALRGKL